MQLDEARGVLEKTSQNKNKLLNEIRWYLKLPEPLRYLLPHIYAYSLDENSPFVKMEYYGYRTLHELMLDEELSADRWREIFNRLLFYVNEMRRYRLEGRQKEIQSAVKLMYVDKTIQRLNSVRDHVAFKHFFDQPIFINGSEHRSINSIIGMLPNLVDEFLLPETTLEFSIIHGDLCFSNILIEETYNFMRLIDPRGSFGSFDIYGDPRYDLAKMFHSMEGHYDYIIADKFSSHTYGNRIDYAVDGNCERIWDMFNEVFEPLIANQMSAIRLIEATLFLSMLPLHSDAPARQSAMLAIGVELFDSILEGSN